MCLNTNKFIFLAKINLKLFFLIFCINNQKKKLQIFLFSFLFFTKYLPQNNGSTLEEMEEFHSLQAVEETLERI